MAEYSESTMAEAASICVEKGIDPSEYASSIYYAIENGFRKEDVQELLYLEKTYRENLIDIAEQCEAEGYPRHGSNFELRANAAYEYYNQEVEHIYASYDEELENAYYDDYDEYDMELYI